MGAGGLEGAAAFDGVGIKGLDDVGGFHGFSLCKNPKQY
jgi:hypothetical protein